MCQKESWGAIVATEEAQCLRHRRRSRTVHGPESERTMQGLLIDIVQVDCNF